MILKTDTEVIYEREVVDQVANALEVLATHLTESGDDHALYLLGEVELLLELNQNPKNLGRCHRCQRPLVPVTIVSERHPDAGSTFAGCPTHGSVYRLDFGVPTGGGDANPA